MKIGGVGSLGPSMGLNGPSTVDTLMEAERIPVKTATERRDKVGTTRDQLKSFDGLLSSFSKTLDGLKKPTDFTKLKIESSHPELLEGTISSGAIPGSFEFEIESLAKAERQLAHGFPDKDKSEVGFGYMRVGSGDLVKDITIEPGSTLNDVVNAINSVDAGVKAMVVNTGMKEDPFRLLVSSIDSGEDAIMEIDEDTTFTEFKNIVKPRNLAVKFEGVDVQRTTNKIDDLIDGVNLNAKLAEPGTKIQVDIKHDVEKTGDGVKDFVKHYNELISFAKKESQIDPTTGKPGTLSGDSSLRSAVRNLQSSVSNRTGGSTLSLMDAGITTDPFSGELKVDEAKLKDALTKNYDGVSAIFANVEGQPGLAQKLSDSVKQLRDSQTGAIATRIKGLDNRIKTQDQEIARKEERIQQKRAQLERTFAALDTKMAGLESTGQFLNARFQNGPAPSEAKKAG